MARTRGGVYFKDGHWYAVPDLGTDPETGKRKRPWLRADRHDLPNTEKGANSLLTKVLREHDEGRRVEPSKLTFGELIELWLSAHEGQVKPRTHANYCKFMRGRPKKELGHRPVQDIKGPELTQWFTKLNRKDGMALSSIRRYYSVMKLVFDHGEAMQLVPKGCSPMHDAKVPKKDANRKREQANRGPHRQKAWTKDQLETWLDRWEGHRLHWAFYTLAGTGMRPEELCGLDVRSVGLENGKLTVEWVRTWECGAVFEDDPKSASGFRDIDLDAKTLAVIKRRIEVRELERMTAGEVWHEDPDGREYLLCDEIGRPLNPNALYNAAIKSIRELIPEGHGARTLYGLRHTHATLLIDAGENVKAVSERLGHSTVAFTLDNYVQTTPAMQRHAAETWGSLLSV